MGGPLTGLKVLDLTRVLAGPYATMILGDLGAEIIKIEVPEIGDESRAFGPFVGEDSAYFMSLNRNKKSITINLKEEKGKEIFFKLLEKSDIVVENFKPGTMEKLGLGYEELKKKKPDIIYAACSGFGHSGPYSHKPAYDAVIQGMGGIMSITGPEGGRPTRVGASIADITAGLYTVIGILSALYHRQITGEGQKIDVAMLDCQVAILENAVARYFVTGTIPKPIGNRHPSIVPFESFETKDGEIMIAVGNDNLWAKFCKVIGREDLINDERFKTNPLRIKNYADLKKILADVIREKNTDEWLKLLDDAAIPSGPINTIDKVVNDPQIIHRNMIVEIEHKRAGKIKIPGIPIKFSKSPGEIRIPSPLLGEHNEEILTELGYDKKEIIEMKEKNII